MQPTEAPQNPWYLRPFFGTAPVLPKNARRVLGLVSIGLFFEQYDLGMINAALLQIAPDLDMPAEDTGFYLGAVRLGGIGTFLLVPLADRLGRRRIFLLALAGMSVGTFLTALCQTPLQFTAAQVFTRTFMLTTSALAIVILVEEFPAEHRGAGLGLLTVLGGMGYGLCAILYAAVDVLPYGWRSLYLIGIAPILLIPFFRRSLQETRRFEESEPRSGHASSQGRLRDWLGPIAEMLRAHPRRAFAVGGAAFLSAIGGIGLFQYTSYYVQEVHGWTPADYSVLVIVGGAIGILGSVIGGRSSDRIGRRVVGSVGFCLAPIFGFLFFFGPSSLLILTWGLFIFCNSAGEVILRALSAELFSTSHRGTATGWLLLVQTLGWTAGLVGVGFMSSSIDELASTLAFATLILLAAGLALLAVPETRGRELEAISDAPDAARGAGR
jgi:MFS family permease